MPFLLAYLFALLIEPVVLFLNKKLHLNRKFASLLTVLSFTSLLIFGLYSLIARLIYEGVGLLKSFGDFLATFPTFLEELATNISRLFAFIPKEIVDFGSVFIPDIWALNLKVPDNLSSRIIDWATGFAKAVPSIFIFIVIFVVATFFISSDKNSIDNLLKKYSPKHLKELFKTTKTEIILTFMRYIKAQFKLMCITFLELFIGLSFLNIPYSLALALSIAVLDALPIIGTGGVLIPWGIYLVIVGDYFIGFGLLSLYGIVLLMRQFLEPKIIGESLGLPPILTLMAMYFGLRFFGFIGMMLGPITLILLVFFNRCGYFDSVWAFLKIQK